MTIGEYTAISAQFGDGHLRHSNLDQKPSTKPAIKSRSARHVPPTAAIKQVVDPPQSITGETDSYWEDTLDRFSIRDDQGAQAVDDASNASTSSTKKTPKRKAPPQTGSTVAKGNAQSKTSGTPTRDSTHRPFSKPHDAHEASGAPNSTAGRRAKDLLKPNSARKSKLESAKQEAVGMADDHGGGMAATPGRTIAQYTAPDKTMSPLARALSKAMPGTLLSPEHGGHSAVIEETAYSEEAIERGPEEKAVLLIRSEDEEDDTVEQLIKAIVASGLRIVIFKQMELSEGQVQCALEH